MLSTVADVASVATPDADRNAGLETASIAASNLSQIDQQRLIWSNATLRRTTLLPGRSLGGLVYILIDYQAYLVWIQIAVGDRRFTFCFQQQASPVRSSARG